MSNFLFDRDRVFVKDWLKKFDICLNDGALPKNILLKRLNNDSRKICRGDVFCAVIGTEQDGRKYIDKAIAQGASLIISESQTKEAHGSITYDGKIGTPIIEFFSLNECLFELATQFYCSPAKKLKIIGVTGTNGKTSTTQIIARLSESLGISCGVIGTTGYGQLPNLNPLENTTPGATELLNILSEFAEQQVKLVAMEVSSHAIEQKRVNNQLFNTSVFTNLTRDHLDYHGTMEAYAKAKLGIFSGQQSQIAVINSAEKYALEWALNNAKSADPQPTITIGRDMDITKYPTYVSASNITHTQTGVAFDLNTHQGNFEVKSHLLGDFNVDNLLAAIAVLIAEGIVLKDIVQAIQNLNPIIGRMESFSAPHKATAVVDYAHTPDALENALVACRQHCPGALWVVFGCGGNRDAGKRKQMGAIAENCADHVVITNDNPRNEQPEAIAKDILEGCKQPEKISVMLDRQKAVISALTQAKENDLVLLAGKGHEDYIIIGDEQIHYDERALVRSTYNNEVVM